MFAHLQPEARINNKTYQQARLAGLGTPLRAYRNTFLRIINIFCLLISIASAVWLCYLIYAYFAFIPLAKKYPTLLAVPLHQLDQYLWLEIMHDSFWYSSLTVVMILLSSLLAFFFYSIGFNTKIYICTEGLLKVEKGKIEAIRWDEVKRLYTTRGNVISLLRKDDSRFTIDNLFYRQPTNRKLSTLIANEASRVRLPHLLEQFERGEIISLSTLQVSKKGLYELDLLLPWNTIRAVELRKGRLYVFAYQLKHVFAKKALIWNEWINDSALCSNSVDLPLLTALINTILKQKHE